MSTQALTSATLQGTDRDSVRAAIGRAAQKTGVDFSYLLNQAKSESGLNPNAKAMTSSASGLFQFIDQTWLGVVKQHGAKHGMGWAANAIQRGSNGRFYVADDQTRRAVFAMRNQSEPASLMAAESAGDNARKLSGALGRTANSTDLYFAHFLGPQGATKFLKAADASPGASAAAAFPREAAVNRGIFYNKSGEARSLQQVYALMSRKINGTGGALPASPAGHSAPLTQMAKAGDLVPVEPGTQLSDIVKVLGESDMQPSTAASSSDMLAMMQHNGRMQILRPSPETAKLAYLLLAHDLDTSVTS